MSAFFFFLIAFFILALGFGYIGVRFIYPSHLTEPWNTLAWILLVFLLLLPPLTMSLVVNRVENQYVDILLWITYLSMGFISFLFTLLVARDLLWLSLGILEKAFSFFRGPGTSSDASTATDLGRRLFLTQTAHLGILGAAATLTAYGFYEARRRPAIVNISVPIANLPVDLEGFRIVQITDIHAGLTVRRPFVEQIVEQVIELDGDLIAFTGDLVDGSVSYLREHVAPLAQLRAPYGQFFVTGNHEYYSGVEPWVDEVHRLGFTVLLNEHRVIRRGRGTILLAGVTDYTGGQFSPQHVSNPRTAVEGAPPCDVKILLAHQPRSLYAALPLGFDLQISGHTHGGQFFPWNLLAAVGQPYIAGFHRHENVWIYVSRGTGYWGPPVRLAARSEITVLTLTRQQSTA
jgi:predicted MPP superfamily phosphohydrolase